MTAEQTSRTVAHLDHWPGPGLGGAEAQVLRLARGAREAGRRVLVVSVPSSPLLDAARDAGVEPVALNVSGARAPLAAWRLARLLHEERVAVLHTHGFLSSVVGRLAGRLARVPTVSTVHCEPHSTLTFDRSVSARVAQPVRDALERVTSRWAYRVVAVAPVVERGLREIEVAQDRIEVIENGVDLGALPVVPSRLGETASPVVGSVGRLEAVKGYGDLLEAAAILRRERGDAVRFALAGDGSECDELRRRAAVLGLAEDAFAFLGYAEEPVAVIASLDVFVAPSLSDTTNLALVEAMALGKPVVAAAAGGLSDVVGEAGLLAAPGDPGALAAAIGSLLDDPSGARRLGRAAAERARERHDARAMVAAYLRLYERAEGAR